VIDAVPTVATASSGAGRFACSADVGEQAVNTPSDATSTNLIITEV
jgi:hypothetical protein